MGFAEKIVLTLTNNMLIQLVIIAIVMDTIFGIIRAVKEHGFNSCFGIDGAIRKIAMIVSIVLLCVVDVLIHINLIGFLPIGVKEWISANLDISVIGIAEFFCVLYLVYEIVSILKNMVLCGLPVKAIWLKVRNILQKYTDELPDSDELTLEVKELREEKVHENK
jgi:toxin secretion/phage lysis holin